jgi:hypothetical protein
MPRPDRSPTLYLGAFVVLFVVGVAAIALGAPTFAIVFVVAGTGASLLLGAVGGRRFEKAEAMAPGALARYPLQFPARRWAVGSVFQFSFLPRTRTLAAPGVLGVSYGEVRFVPTKAGREHTAWTGRPTAVEILSQAQTCSVRFQAPEGAAQFSVDLPPKEVRTRLEQYLEVEP